MQVPESSLDGGRISENIMHFARLLRAAGLPVGPGKALDAIRAVNLVGFSSRADFHSCLFAIFVSRREQRELFDQAFHIFWRNPRFMERMLGAMLPTLFTEDSENATALRRRLADAMGGTDNPRESAEDRLELQGLFTSSPTEVLRERDFEDMSAAELEQAKRAIASLRLPHDRITTRRYRPDPNGRQFDRRASLRALTRSSEGAPLKFRKRGMRQPPLVVICDISGSMSTYSRMFLHFMHAIAARRRVHSFVFGTRLTHISRQLAHSDVDFALAKVSTAVEDWSGGTRIGHCLHEFNRRWARRVLGQSATTLLLTDGLERDEPGQLASEIERLARASRRLIWLNPLLRWDGFEPLTQGARAILPHTSDFRSAHNLESFEELTRALSGSPRDLAVGQPDSLPDRA